MIEGRTALYRFFDGDGELLYVGITFSPPKRFSAHRREKPDWALVARVSVEWCDTRAEAERRERAAIRSESPRWNVTFAHVPTIPQQRVTLPDLTRDEIRDLEWFLANMSAAVLGMSPGQRAAVVGRYLNMIPNYQAMAARERRAALLELRAARLSYAEIGAAVGLKRGRVQQIVEGR